MEIRTSRKQCSIRCAPKAAVLWALAGVAIGQPALATNDASSMHLSSAGYRNVIPARSFPVSYTEVCWLDGGGIATDVHAAGEHTQGGNCEPGDAGWVIARQAFEPLGWRDAAQACDRVGMRLPRVIEWQMSCRHARLAELTTIEGGWEWAQNATHGGRRVSRRGDVVSRPGEAICRAQRWNYVATFGSDELGERGFRCAR